MKKLFLTLLSAALALTASADQFYFAGYGFDTSADSPADFVANLNALENVTATGSAVYKAATKTLTLTDFVLECGNNQQACDIPNEAITIVLEGENRIAQTNTEAYYAGIRFYYDVSDADVTITGSGSLTVTSVQWFPINLGSGSLTIDGTTLDAHVTDNGLRYGIQYNNTPAANLTIKNSYVKVDKITRINNLTLTDCRAVLPTNVTIGTSGEGEGQGLVVYKNGNYYLAEDCLIIPTTFAVDGLKYSVYNVSNGYMQVSVAKQDWDSPTLVIPDSVEYKGLKFQVYNIINDAFASNNNITSVDIACKQIWSGAFSYCKNLTSVTLQEGVKSIYEHAFQNIGATTIHLPASLESLDGNSGSPFSYNKFTDITIAEGNTSLVKGEDGVIYNKQMTKILAFPYNYEKKFKEIPASVTSILDQTFISCKNLADTLVVPPTLAGANRAFSDTNIKCVIYNNGQYSLSNVFQGNASIREVILGPECTRVGQLMFWNCSNIEKITVLSQEMPILYNPSYASFYSTTNANAKVYVHCGQSATYLADVDKWAKFEHIIDTLLYDVDVLAEHATAAVTPTTDCDKVQLSISDIESGYQFVNWSNGATETTTTITVTSDTIIRANVKKILAVGDVFTFNSVEEVPVTYKVLTNTEGSKTVQVGNGTVQAIPKSTSGTLTIPDSAVYFDEKFEVVAMADYAIKNCNELKVLHLPNTISSLGLQSVYECSLLQEVNIPNQLENTGQYNFAYMNKLKSITMPSSVKYLNYGTFSFNYVMEEITGWNPSQFERVGIVNWYYNSPLYRNTDYFQDENGYRYMGDVLINMPDDESITVKEGTRIVVGSSSKTTCKSIEFPASITALSSGVLFSFPLLETCTIKAVTPPVVYCAYDVATDKDATGLREYGSSCSPQYGGNPTPEDVKYYVPKSAIATYKADDKWNMLNLCPIGGWTITFVANGETLSEQQVEQGEMPVEPTPDTYYTAEHMYVFDHWDATVVPATEDVTYTAVYSEQQLPNFYVCFYANEEDALAHTNRVARVEKQYGSSAEEAAATIIKNNFEAKECEMITGWNGGDITNVTAEMHIWPEWGDGQYTITFFDPIADAAIAVRSNVECGDIVEAPEAPAHEGKTFTGWDSDAWQATRFSADLLINAVYVDSTPTGIDNLGSQTNIRKIVRDGQVLIIRDGKTYNALGQEMK